MSNFGPLKYFGRINSNNLQMTVIKEDIRDQIIDSARNIFSRFGFKKTTMEEIAHAMHKGKSSIYYYFKSKEEIFEAVVEKEVSILRHEVITATAMTSSPKEKLRIYIITRMREFKRMTNFYEAIKNDYLSHLEFINKIRIKYDENEIRIIADFLTQGVKENEFIVNDVDLAAIAIATAMKGLEIPLFWSGKENEFEERINNVVALLYNGIVKR
jgi:AcrR family transcriptional regulator